MGWDNGLMGSQWCFRKNKANTVAHHRRACDAAGCPAAARRVLRPPRRWGRASSPPPHWAPPLVPIARGPILAATARAPPKIWIFIFKIVMNFQKVWPGLLTDSNIYHARCLSWTGLKYLKPHSCHTVSSVWSMPDQGLWSVFELPIQ